MTYSKLSLVDFGTQLLKTGDLDPAYIALHRAGLSAETLAKFCLAYWCFYSFDTASRLAEARRPVEFWRLMLEAARNEGVEPDGKKPWPRGAERRHFRGAQAINSIASLRAKYDDGRTCEAALKSFIGANYATMTFASVSRAVRSHLGFGDWIAFKVADMSERVLGYEVDFSNCELGIYKDPRQGAAVAYLERTGTVFAANEVEQPAWEFPINDAQLEQTVAHYVKRWRSKNAPPNFNRRVNVQEIETIFCKYKSHLKGHYPLNKDSEELLAVLAASSSRIVAPKLFEGLQSWFQNLHARK